MRRFQTIFGSLLIVGATYGWNVLANPGAPRIPWYIALAGIALVWFVSGVHAVDTWSRIPVQFFGDVKYAAGPGFTFIEPVLLDPMDPVSVQIQNENVPAKAVQTQDNVPVDLVGLVRFRVSPNHVVNSVVRVKAVHQSTVRAAISTLVDIAGSTNLNDLLKHRDLFCDRVVDALKKRVAEWGVEIIAFELQHFEITDQEIGRAIADNAKAEMMGRAQVTLATFQAEVRNKNNEAAEGYTDRGWALKLLETLQQMAASPSSTIFTIPEGLMSVMAGLGKLPPQHVGTRDGAPDQAA